MSKGIPIIILSRNYSNGLAVARSLGSEGYAIYFIASSFREGANEIAAKSKYIKEFSEVVSKKVSDER